VGVR
jgi:hypothetical protein